MFNDEGFMYLHGRCHPTSPTWAAIKDGTLVIVCVQCKKKVTQFKVEQ